MLKKKIKKSGVIIKTIDEIKESDKVQQILSHLVKLAKPQKSLSKYLNNIENLSKFDTDVIEEYLAVFTSWQNYLSEQSVIADVVKTTAESQMNYVYSLAVVKAVGTINEKKEIGRQSSSFIKAQDIYENACAIKIIFENQFENCDRAYRLASRILTKRLEIKEV